MAKSKDMGKRFPQLYYIKMKISYDLLQSESPWQLNDAIWFLFIFAFLCIRSFLRNRLREFVPGIIASIMAKFEQILCERFRNILKRSFKHHINSEIACYPHN